MAQEAKLLEARVVAWRRSAQSAGCIFKMRPRQRRSFNATGPATCGDLDLDAVIRGDDLSAASTKVGEFLRLLHAATARPVYLPRYDWLQQLLWPDVCTMVNCRCCGSGDRRVTLQLACTTSELKEPLPQVIADALFAWDGDAASAEYHALITAIQADAGGATPDQPLRLTVDLLPGWCRVVDYPAFLQSCKTLVQGISAHLSGWFQVQSFSASLNSGIIMVTTLEDLLTMITSSNLPLALPNLTPLLKPCDTSLHQWLFGHHQPWKETSPQMPILLDLPIRFIGAPSARVYDEFCTWLANNSSLKTLTLRIPTSLKASTPRHWDNLGFALFSPSSKLKLDQLDLDIRGINDSNIDSMVNGSQRVIVQNSQGRKHSALKLETAGVSITLLIKFIRHFSNAARSFQVAVYGDHAQYRQVLHAILESNPELENLEVTLSLTKPDKHSIVEPPFVATTAPTNLRSLTLCDMRFDTGFDAVAHTLRLDLSRLEYLRINRIVATRALADLILDHCPALQSLIVGTVEADFWERLLDGYTTGRCKISELSVGTVVGPPSPWVFDMVGTLANPVSLFTRTLRKLQLDCQFVVTELTPAHRLLLEKLDSNAFLVELSLPHCIQERGVVGAKSGDIVANVSYPLPPRQRYALLSCASSLARGLLPPDIWRLILELSARPARRSVTMHIPRHMDIGS